MGRRYTQWGLANAVVVIAALFPIFWILMLSLKDPATINDGRLIPSNWSFENYKGIFHQSVFTRALVNSIGIALISTLIAVVLASMAAYAIARLNFPGKTLMLTAALAIAMFPPISIVGPLYNMWRNLGLYDTWPGLIIPYMTFTLPLAIYTLSAFFREIPWELEQAAQVDGATPFQAFTQGHRAARRAGRVHHRDPRLHLRLERLRLRGLADLDEGGPDGSGRDLASSRARRSSPQPTGSIAAAAMVVTVPIIIMVLFFQRRIVAGLTAGAVKG